MHEYNEEQAKIENKGRSNDHALAPDAVANNAVKLVVRYADDGATLHHFKVLAKGFNQTTKIIARTLMEGRNVLVCCNSERYSCATAVLSAYLQIKEQVERDDALAMIQKRSPTAEPNQSFHEGLLSIDNHVKDKVLNNMRAKYRKQMLDGTHGPPRANDPL